MTPIKQIYIDLDYSCPMFHFFISIYLFDQPRVFGVSVPLFCYY